MLEGGGFFCITEGRKVMKDDSWFPVFVGFQTWWKNAPFQREERIFSRLFVLVLGRWWLIGALMPLVDTWKSLSMGNGR